jgi:hypothetical protein
MKYLIPTCDRYSEILQLHKITMDYFGAENFDVVVLGYTRPNWDMGNWEFFKLMDVDPGPGGFTTGLLNFFNEFDDDYFIYGSDDATVVAPIDLELLDELKLYAKNNENVSKISLNSGYVTDLTPNRGHTLYKNMGDYDLIKMSQTAEYRLGQSCCIWKTSHYKSYLSANLSPWQFELRNNAKNDGTDILGTGRKYVFYFGHIMRRNIGLVPNWWRCHIGTDNALPDKLKEECQKILRNSRFKGSKNI